MLQCVTKNYVAVAMAGSSEPEAILARLKLMRSHTVYITIARLH